MFVRTTVDIPEPLHAALRQRAESAGTSIGSLIVFAIEQTYANRSKGRYVTGALAEAAGTFGPAFSGDENPQDFVLS